MAQAHLVTVYRPRLKKQTQTQTQSEASQTYTTGLTVFVGASGQCIDSNDHSSKKLGLYVGEGDASVAAGTLIPVMTAGADIA